MPMQRSAMKFGVYSKRRASQQCGMLNEKSIGVCAGHVVW